MAVLQRGESYGYQILTILKETKVLTFSESTLYPMLSRMTAAGLLSVRNGPSERGKPRKYYQLTNQGRGRLLDMLEQWSAMSSAINHLTDGA